MTTPSQAIEDATAKLMTTIVEAIEEGIKDNMAIDDFSLDTDLLLDKPIKGLFDKVGETLSADTKFAGKIAQQLQSKFEQAIDSIDAKELGAAIAAAVAQQILANASKDTIQKTSIFDFLRR